MVLYNFFELILLIWIIQLETSRKKWNNFSTILYQLNHSALRASNSSGKLCIYKIHKIPKSFIIYSINYFASHQGIEYVQSNIYLLILYGNEIRKTKFINFPLFLVSKKTLVCLFKICFKLRKFCQTLLLSV